MPYDIYIEGITDQNDDFKGREFLTFGNYNNGGTVGVRGVHKLVSRFLKCFLTPKGSDLSDPNYGTSLSAAFLSNVNADTLSRLASQSVQEALDVLREYDSEYDLDDDERISSADIQDLYVDESNMEVIIRIRLRNMNGEEALFTIPGLFGSNNG